MSKDVIINEVDSETAMEHKPKISLVLDNGDDLVREIEKAQQMITELNRTLDHIKNFTPRFHYSR